ncbi:glycosyltransferase family 4 protein [Candidatus Saccharibacteria bacterium]|nr:glycosyltransferase family 4 protein [Candidatus Saccharibacteria bacterium]
MDAALVAYEIIYPNKGRFMKKVAIASHVAMVEGAEYDGIGNALKEIMPDVTDEYIFIKHSIDGNTRSKILHLSKSKQLKLEAMLVFARPSPLRYVSEIFSTISKFTFRYKIDVFIGIDPLNALSGVLLKKFNRVETVIFYTADYSMQRFSNKVLNSIYHYIDRVCVKHADQVWSVSSKIVEVRREMGLEEGNNVFLPNVPPEKFNKYYTDNRDKHTLVTSGIIDTQLDFVNLFDAINRLKTDYPDIKLKVFGNGPQRPNLEKYIREHKLEEQVLFMGKVPLSDMLSHVARAGVGIALYTGEWGFNEYGDSTKCREYFNFGLPVLSTDTHSTVKEIVEFGAGEIVSLSAEQYEQALRKIFNNYEVYSKQSKKLGEKYSGLHTKLLYRLINR